LINLNSLYTRIICRNFDWNWPAGSKQFSVFARFCNYLPQEKRIDLRLFNSKFRFLKDELCKPWWKLAQRSGSSKSRKCENLKDRRADRRQVIIKVHLSFWFRWDNINQNCSKHVYLKITLTSIKGKKSDFIQNNV
jgi:hypothetical protein